MHRLFSFTHPLRSAARLLSIALILTFAVAVASMQRPRSTAENDMVAVAGHLPALVAQSRLLDRAAAQENVPLALTLAIPDQAALTEFLEHVTKPGDPLYGHYLTPAAFTERFGPSQADYDAVADYARSNGLTVVATHSNRLVLDVQGPASAVEKAFGTQLMRYQAPNGSVFRAPQTEPGVPAAIAARLTGVIGLDTAAVRRPHHRERPAAGEVRVNRADPRGGSGPDGGLTPKDIKNAYSLTGTTLNGSGQVLGLFQLDGYRSSDVFAYEDYFGLPHVTLQNVLVDGFNGSPGSGASEVTLDIELMVAMAPGASKIIVYEGPNTDPGVIDTYNRMATDNLARQLSSSWGLDETSTGASVRNAENAIFQQMAAQGQSFYCAGGDAGAYDDGATLSVDDPASQPYVTAVGGTTLASGTGAAYLSETTWNNGSVSRGAGGGGISRYWTIPSYQTGVVSSASNGSMTRRNVPDVALNADPNTGYAIYYNGGWHVYGGTSCAAPLWAGFTALVNQQRAANGSAPLGFANSLLYTLGQGTRSSSDFHDIADGSTNLYYPAVSGYDVATGWGSIKGAGLLTDLMGAAPVPFDFNSDGQPDLLWQNQATGDATYWAMSKAQWPGQWAYLERGTPTNWKIAAAPDVNGDGQSDLVWQNQTTGDVTYWILSKGVWNGSWGYIARNISTDWKLVSSADLFGDGSVSLVWQNQATGDAAYWKMNGAQWDGAWNYLARSVPTDWKIVGSGDLDGDGQSDLVWQNQTTGDVTYWILSKGVYTGTWAYIARNVPTDWKIEGVLDLTGDGQPDFVWRNQTTGDVTYWQISAMEWTGQWAYIARNVPTTWKMVGVH